MWKENDKKVLNSFLKWFAIIISIKLAIIFFFFLHIQNKTINSKQETKQIPNFCFNEKCINLEIAKTPQERELWLMFRETLEKDSWMFFSFDWLWKHSIWMKNTLIPLDIIRLTTGYKVVDIVSAPPCKQEDFLCFLKRGYFWGWYSRVDERRGRLVSVLRQRIFQQVGHHHVPHLLQFHY